MEKFDYRLVHIKTQVREQRAERDHAPTSIRVLDLWPEENEEYGQSFYRRTFVLSYYKGFFFESDDEIETHFEIQRSPAGKCEWTFFTLANTQQTDSESWD